MQIQADIPEQYIAQLPEDRRAAMQQLRSTILDSLPEGFAETTGYGMITYVVPHALYPAGYHCDPATPLPFLSIASQKNFIALYHMGIYMDEALLSWFVDEYPRHVKTRLDMGKSCIRFKKVEQIPYALIGELASRVTVADWVRVYEAALNR